MPPDLVVKKAIEQVLERVRGNTGLAILHVVDVAIARLPSLLATISGVFVWVLSTGRSR
jgi:hypothetical protein